MQEIASVRTSDLSTTTEDSWHTDDESSIRWAVGNDGEFLYLSLRLEDRLRRALVRRRGLTVYFDSDGGRNEDVFVHYPFTPSSAEDELSSQPRPNQIESSEILWHRGEEEIVLNPHFEKTAIRASLSEGPKDVLSYSLRIPLDSLSSVDGSPVRRVSIGIEQKRPERLDAGPRLRTEGRGRPGGSIPGGSARPGNSRRPAGVRTPSGTPNRAITGEVSLWFLVRLQI